MLTRLIGFLYLSLIELKDMPKAAPKKTSKKVASKAESVIVVDNRNSNDKPLIAGLSKRVVVLGLIVIGGGILLFLAYRWLVVAWVDQTPITRVEMYKQLEARYGKDLMEQMVTETLITNEAKNRKVSVSKEEVAAEVKKLEDQQGGADKLDQVLGFQGMTRAELEKQISYQLLIRRMFGDGVTVSDEDVNQYIESNKEQLGEVDDQTKVTIREQLVMQKIGQAFNTWLTENKSGSRVVRYN